MCSMATGPPSGGGLLGKAFSAAAFAQAAVTLANLWFVSEGEREVTLRQEQDLRRELETLNAQSAAYGKVLEATVGFEASRAASFSAAMAALSSTPDPETRMEILRMASEILERDSPISAIRMPRTAKGQVWRSI